MVFSISALVFILSTGVDPAKDVYALGKKLGFEAPGRLCDISLGQGQGNNHFFSLQKKLEKFLLHITKS